MTSKKMPLMRRIHGAMFKLPLMITCEEFEEFILAYLEGDLSASQKFVFEMHLKVCRECREFLAAYQNAMSLTKGTLVEETKFNTEDVPEDLIQAVLAAQKK